MDPDRREVGDPRRQGLVGWRALTASLMWSVFVVMRDVLPEDGKQVPPTVDQDSVQALAAYCTHPPLGLLDGQGFQGHRGLQRDQARVL